MAKKAEKKKTEEVDYSKPLLSIQYEKFCQAYMLTGNATQAAKDAKYSEKTANVKGSQLLTIISIKNRMAVLQAQLSKETGISIKMVAEGFRKIATGVLDKGLTNKNKLRAYENLGKHVGFYREDNKQKVDALGELLASLDGNSKGLPTQ
jgi:phage terminase small subunit